MKLKNTLAEAEKKVEKFEEENNEKIAQLGDFLEENTSLKSQIQHLTLRLDKTVSV